MQISKKELPNREIELTITLSPETIQKYEHTTAQKLSENLNISGFRKGKAPANIVKKHVSEPVFQQYLLDEAIPQSYLEAIKSEKITPVARPKIEITSEEPLTFKATIALDPEVKLKDIDKLKIKRQPVKVEEKELEGTIYELKKYQATYKDVDRPAKKGDRVEIDFEGFDESGKSLDGTKSKNHPLVLGDDQFVPGFEDELIGMKKGDTKSFTVKFPKDYHKEDFQNKKVKFEVALHRIEEMELPEINEELSQKLLGKKLDKEGFIAEIKADILRQKEQRENQRQQAELFEELIKKADLQLSDLLIREELDYMLHQQRHDIEHRGIKWEQFLEMLKNQGRNLEEERKPEAEQRVKARYIIREIIKAKDLKVADKDVVAKLTEQGLGKEHHSPTASSFIQEKDRQMLDQLFELFLEPKKK